jgi:hypothetical protein
MRCLSCNTLLNSYESTRKSDRTGEFLDLCSDCFHTIDSSVRVQERLDLKNASDDVYYKHQELDFSKLTFNNDFKEDFE